MLQLIQPWQQPCRLWAIWTVAAPCSDRPLPCSSLAHTPHLAPHALPQVVSDPTLKKSGVYWSWSNNTGSFENQLSEEASDDAKGSKLWDVSMKLVGLA